MLYRKFEKHIEKFFREEPNKILLVNGARQIGKSYLIRYVGQKLFKNYIEINLKEDKESRGIFATAMNTEDFYMQLGTIAGNRLGSKEDTLIFLDEIQSYPHLMTMLKFLNQEGRYTYVASGSQLGVALSETASVPIGSVEIEEMYPLDFEEFLLAMGCGQETIESIREKFFAGGTVTGLASLVAEHVELESVQCVVQGEFPHEAGEQVVGVFAGWTEPQYLLSLVVALEDIVVSEGFL